MPARNHSSIFKVGQAQLNNPYTRHEFVQVAPMLTLWLAYTKVPNTSLTSRGQISLSCALSRQVKLRVTLGR